MNRYNKRIFAIALLLLLIYVAKFGLSQVPAITKYHIITDVIDQGGARSHSTRFTLSDAVGQPGTVGSARFRLASGFLGGSAQSPALAATPQLLDFGNELTQLTFQIQNTGAGTLTWSVIEQPDEPWISSISPASGTNNAIITVTVERSGMQPGNYAGTLVITSNAGIQNISVYISVGSSKNILVNGDFSNGSNGWWLFVHELASANGSIVNGEYAISINNGSNVNWHIQLLQNNVLVEYGKSYSISFDAYAASRREIGLYVRKDSPPYTIYSDNYKVYSLNTSMHTYTHRFTMNEESDHLAAFSFDLGNSNIDVYFDNIYLVETPATTTDENDHDKPVGLAAQFQLLQNYPNPFNPVTTIPYNVAHISEISVRIFNAEGQLVKTLLKCRQLPGYYSIQWDGKNDFGQQQTSGIYLCQVTTNNVDRVIKMVMIK